MASCGNTHKCDHSDQYCNDGEVSEQPSSSPNHTDYNCKFGGNGSHCDKYKHDYYYKKCHKDKCHKGWKHDEPKCELVAPTFPDYPNCTQFGEGKKVLITGGFHGNGLATALTMIANGSRVMITSRTPDCEPKRPDGCTGGPYLELCQLRKLFDISQLQLKDEYSIECLVKRVRDKYGKIDVLVVNAARLWFGTAIKGDVKTMKESFQVGTFGHITLIQQLFKYDLINKNARIIFIISGATMTKFHKYNFAYSSMKSVLSDYADAVAVELAEEYPDLNVQITKVYPGFVNTCFYTDAIAGEDIIKNTSLGDFVYKFWIPGHQSGVPSLRVGETVTQLATMEIDDNASECDHPHMPYNVIVTKDHPSDRGFREFYCAVNSAKYTQRYTDAISEASASDV